MKPKPDSVTYVRFGGSRRKRWASARAKNAWARSRSPGWGRFIPFGVCAALIGTILAKDWIDGPWQVQRVQGASAQPGIRASFGYCHGTGQYNCVVDGDTIWFQGQNIRIADIDAPETRHSRCSAEKELGDRATRRLRDLLHGGPITLQASGRDEDMYGRKLRIVLVNGESVGEALVSEGYARWYGNGRRPWC